MAEDLTLGRTYLVVRVTAKTTLVMVLWAQLKRHAMSKGHENTESKGTYHESPCSCCSIRVDLGSCLHVARLFSLVQMHLCSSEMTENRPRIQRQSQRRVLWLFPKRDLMG